MRALRTIAAIAVIGLLASDQLVATKPPSPSSPPTPLDTYVAKPDPAFSWKLVKTVPGDGYTTFVVDLQSQTWLTSKVVDRTVWQHWLVIVKPDVVKHDTALL